MLVVFCMVRTFGLFGYLRCAIFRLVLSMADFFNENASPKAYCDYSEDAKKISKQRCVEATENVDKID